jgi:hypothetical protein
MLTRSNDAENEKERLLSVSLHALSRLVVKDTEYVHTHRHTIQDLVLQIYMIIYR